MTEIPEYDLTLPSISGLRFKSAGWRPFSRERKAIRVVPVANVRARIAYVLLSIFAGTILAGFITVDAHWGTFSDVRNFIEPLVTAEVSLLGAVMGFYYATHQNELSNLEKVSAPNKDDPDSTN